MKINDNAGFVLMNLGYIVLVAIIIALLNSCGGTYSPEERLKTILCESAFACMPDKVKPVEECIQEDFSGYWGQSEECMDCLERLEPCEVLSAEKQEECGCNE